MSKRKKHTFTLSEAAKKKLVLNLPYCMIGLYATKLGQAWRMAEGTNLSEKLLHLGDGFASAFASSLPSFHSADLLVGLLAGLLLRLAVYLKSKDAKKFRKGREYGSARWGTRKDIEPFIDPVFKNNILLTQTEQKCAGHRRFGQRQDPLPFEAQSHAMPFQLCHNRPQGQPAHRVRTSAGKEKVSDSILQHHQLQKVAPL